MATLITQATLKAGFRDQRQGKRYDVSDSRIPGLQLRVKALSVRWSVRVRLFGVQRRYDLGPAVEGEHDGEGLSLPSARARAIRITEMARKGHNPSTFLAAIAGGVSIETQFKLETSKPKPSSPLLCIGLSIANRTSGNPGRMPPVYRAPRCWMAADHARFCGPK